MKMFIKWLAKIFKVDITTEKIVIKEVIKEVPKYVALGGFVKDSLTVEGDLTVTGSVYVKGDCIAYGSFSKVIDSGLISGGGISAYKIGEE